MTQKEAIKIMKDGGNIFLTGAPGAGKTYTLNKFIESIEKTGKRIAITASTGIAASHIGGTTIHSWSGTGIAEELTLEDLQRHANNSRLVKRMNRTDILVIDEVSMLHGKRLDMVNTLAKKLRNSDQPFGGIQVILVGDLFQLPPVTRDGGPLDFAHKSQAWQELDLQICYITEQHRQAGEDSLLVLLEDMRQNRVGDSHRKLLNSRVRRPEDESGITRLFSHNADVDNINQRHLDALQAKPHFYGMTSSGNPRKVEALMRNILAPHRLELKIGAEVMFVANNFDAGFFNGTRGKVIAFKKNTPIVKLRNGRKIHVEKHSWVTKEDDTVVAEVEQLPLRPAWAITIHKSQGMSLDSAEVDLSQAFTPGMGYVALSRVRSLDGLFLKGFNDMALSMHDEIYDLDAQLRQASEALVGR